MTQFRKLESVDVGSRAGVRTDAGTLVVGEVVAMKPGPFFTSAVMRCDGSEDTVIVHKDALCEEPLAEVAGRMVYAGDILWDRYSTQDDTYFRLRVTGRLRSDLLAAEALTDHVSRDRSAPIERLRWEITSPAQDAEIRYGWRRPAAAADSRRFLHVFESVPNGSREVPGSRIYPTYAAAKAAKHTAQLVGIFELSKAEE